MGQCSVIVPAPVFQEWHTFVKHEACVLSALRFGIKLQFLEISDVVCQLSGRARLDVLDQGQTLVKQVQFSLWIVLRKGA